MTSITLVIPRTLLDRANGRATRDGVVLQQIAVSALKAYLGVSEPIETAFQYNLPRTPEKVWKHSWNNSQRSFANSVDRTSHNFKELVTSTTTR